MQSPKLEFNSNLPASVSSLLLQWKEQIEKNERAHRINANWYRIANLSFGFPAVILSGLYTAGALITVKECSSSDYLWVCVPQIIFGCIVTICSSILTFGNFANNASLNKEASNRYQEINRTIETYLHTKNHVDPAVILSIIQTRYNDTVNASPVLPVEKDLKFFIKRNKTYTVRNDESLDEEMIEKIKSYSLQTDPEFIYQQERLKENLNNVV